MTAPNSLFLFVSKPMIKKKKKHNIGSFPLIHTSPFRSIIAQIWLCGPYLANDVNPYPRPFAYASGITSHDSELARLLMLIPS